MTSRFRTMHYHEDSDGSPKHRIKSGGSYVKYALESACFSIKSRGAVWALFAAMIATQLFCGVIYIFGVISQTLISNNFTPTQVDFLYACGTMGQYFGIIPGYLHDLAGPIVTLGYGLVCTTLGYGAVSLLLSQSLCSLTATAHLSYSGLFESFLSQELPELLSAPIPGTCPSTRQPPSESAICALGAAMFFMTQGGAALHYSVFPTLLMQYPPQKRGLVSGLIAASYGLSGIVLTSIYQAAFSPSSSAGDRPRLMGFLLLVGGLVLGFSIVLLLLLWQVRNLREIPSTPMNAEKAPLYTYGPDSESAASEGQLELRLPGIQRRHSSMVALEIEETPTCSTLTTDGLRDSPTLSDPDSSRSSLASEIFSAKYLTYMLIQALMQGTCAAVIGNVSLIREASMPFTDDDFLTFDGLGSAIWSVAILVQIISAGNFLGRIFSGFVSQCMPTRVYSLFFLQSAILIGLAQLALYMTAPSSNGVLVAALFCTAWAMGSNFAIGPVWIMQSFAPKHFASLQATVMGGIAIATFALSMFTGRSYEAHAHTQHLAENVNHLGADSGEHLVCRGSACFATPQLLKLSGSLISAALSALLMIL